MASVRRRVTACQFTVRRESERRGRGSRAELEWAGAPHIVDSVTDLLPLLIPAAG